MWGKRRKAKMTKAWGFKSTIKKAPSKGRPATRKRWVARVTRLRPRNVKRHLRPPSKNASRNMPAKKGDEEMMKMHDRLLRRRQVEETTGLSRSSIYRLMKKGKFPLPVRVGPSAVRWRASDITAWLESRPVARSELGTPNAAWIRPS